MSTAQHDYAKSIQPPGALAPAKVGHSAPPKQEQPSFVTLIKDRIKRFAAEDRDSDWRMFARYVVVEKFFQGEQFGKLSKLDGSWRMRPRKDGDPRYVHNIVRGHARGILSQWTQARTELTVIPLPDGDATDDAKGAARAAEAMLSHYQRRLLTEEFRQRETMSAMTTGQMFRYSYWDQRVGENYARRPMWGLEEVQSPATFACLDCGEGGEIPDADMGMDADSGSDFPVGDAATRFSSAGGIESGDRSGAELVACPGCGSQDITVEDPQSFQLPKVQGYENVSLGDLCCLSVPGYQLKYDRIPVRFRDSMWLRWRVYVRAETVKEIIPNYKKQAGGEQDDWGFRAEQSLKKSTGNVEASGARLYGQNSNRTDAELVTVDRWWFKPEIYADFVLQEDIPLANGDLIPAGTKAIEAFPHGLYALVVDNEPRDFRDELFTDHWQHTPAVLLASRIDGDGLLDDLIEPQREMNDVKGLKLANIKYVCGAGLMLRSEYLDRSDISGKPFEIAVVKPGTPPEIKNTEIITPIPRLALPSEVYAYDEQLMEEMRWMAASQQAAMGEGDPNQKTLGGQQLLSQAARSQRAPELALRASGDVECAEQWLRLLQKNLTDEAYFPFDGKVGKRDGAYFKNTDIPKKFAVSHRPRSFMPKGETERRADFMDLIGAFGGFEGLMMAAQAMPEIVEEACDRFNVTLDLSGTNLAAQVARLRLEAMKAMLPAAQQSAAQFSDEAIAVQVLISSPETSVDPDDDHGAFIKWYVKWKLEDEGQEARVKNPLLYAAVSAQIQNHKMAMVGVQQEQGQMEIAAQAPQMQLQQQMRQEQMGQQQGMAQEQAGQQAQQQQAQFGQQEMSAEAQRQHEAQQGEASHQRALELEKEKQKGQLAIAKARFKGAGK